MIHVKENVVSTHEMVELDEEVNAGIRTFEGSPIFTTLQEMDPVKLGPFFQSRYRPGSMFMETTRPALPIYTTRRRKKA